MSKYRAFLSYCRADARIARWLHNSLDQFRTPKALRGGSGAWGEIPDSLHPIFRDTTDLPGGGRLSQRLEDALNDSSALIVLCTPQAAASRWVNEEVTHFQKLGRGERIFPVIADGEPDSDDPARECLPPSLRGQGLLAADLRDVRLSNGAAVGDGREGARLKLIAGLLGVPLDALAQRERRRRRLLVAGLGAAAALFAVLSVATGILAWRSTQAERAARDTLMRIFADRSWELNQDGQSHAAARYAVGGSLLSPANAQLYRDALAAIHQSAGASRPLIGHQGPTQTAAISSDGRYAVTGGDDASVRVWNGDTGEQIAVLAGNERPIVALTFSADGQLLFSLARDGALHVWRTSDWSRVGSRRAHRGAGKALIALADGHSVISAGWDGNVAVTTIAGGRIEQRFSVHAHDKPIWRIAISPAGDAIVTASEDGSARVLGLRDGQLLATFMPEANPSRAAALEHVGFCSPSRIVTVDRDQRARAWDVASGQQVWENAILADNYADRLVGGAVLLACLSDRAVATAGPMAVIYDLETGQADARYRHRAGVTGISFLPQQRMVTTQLDGAISIWNSGQSAAPIRTLRAHAGAVLATACSMSGRCVSAGEDGIPRLWQSMQDLYSFADAPGAHIAFDPTRPEQAVIDHEGRVAVLSENGTRRRVLFQTNDRPYELRYSANGNRLLTISNDAISVWNKDDGRQLAHVARSPRRDDELSDVYLSRDGRMLTWRMRDEPALALLEVDSGRAARRIRPPHGRLFNAILSPAGDRIVMVLEGRDPVLLTAPSGREIRELAGHTNEISAVVFSPSGQLVATSTSSGDLLVWRARDGQVVARMTGHQGGIQDIAFSADEAQLVSGSRDRTVRLWDIQSEALIASFGPISSFVNDVWITPDGQRIFASDGDQGVVYAWGVASGRQIAMWSSSRYRVNFSSDWRWMDTGGGQLTFIHNATASLDELVELSCRGLLVNNTRFTDAELNSDALLRNQWARRDPEVCGNASSKAR